MTDFGDSLDRQYTMVLPDRTDVMDNDPFHNEPHTVDEMREMAVQTAHYTTATVHPLPLTPDEIINGCDFDEFDVFYMEVETLTGEKHRFMFKHESLTYIIQAVRNHALLLLENKIRRTGSPETVGVLDAIKKLMDKMEEGNTGL